MANDCEFILNHGIYDFVNTHSIRERNSSFLNWLKSSNTNSVSSSSSTTIDASVPIFDIVADFAFGQDKTKKEEFRSFLETFNSASDSDFQKLDEITQKINPKVLDVLNNCINSTGVRYWVEFTFDPLEFILHTRFNPFPDAKEDSHFEKLDFGSGQISTNDGSIASSTLKVNTTTIIDTGIRSQTFRRINDSPFTLTVKAKFGDEFTYAFPGSQKLQDCESNFIAVGSTQSIVSSFQNKGEVLLDTLPSNADRCARILAEAVVTSKGQGQLHLNILIDNHNRFGQPFVGSNTISGSVGGTIHIPKGKIFSIKASADNENADAQSVTLKIEYNKS